MKNQFKENIHIFLKTTTTKQANSCLAQGAASSDQEYRHNKLLLPVGLGLTDCTAYCEILGSYLQQNHQHHIFRAQI